MQSTKIFGIVVLSKTASEIYIFNSLKQILNFGLLRKIDEEMLCYHATIIIHECYPKSTADTC